MKHIPADCAAHALVAVWSSSTVIASMASTIAPQLISDERALSITLTSGVASGVVAFMASKGGGRERFATFFSSIAFSVWFGPVAAHAMMAWLQIPLSLTTQVMFGTSGAMGLFGWPFYKLVLALFVASGENASGIGQFFGAFVKTYLRKGDK